MATRAQPSPKCLEKLSPRLRPPQSERIAWEQSDDLSTYTDGKRVVWTNGSQFMTKLDHDTFDIISTLRLPGSDHADTLTREQFIKAFDSKSNFDQKRATVKKSGYPPISGVEIGPLVRESAKLDPSLPPPNMSAARAATDQRSSKPGSGANPVAAAMTDQFVRNSARIDPSPAAPK